MESFLRHAASKKTNMLEVLNKEIWTMKKTKTRSLKIVDMSIKPSKFLFTCYPYSLVFRHA